MDRWQDRKRKTRTQTTARQVPPTIQPKAPVLNHSTVQRMATNPHDLLPHEVLHLQSTIGNQAVMRLLSERSSLRVGPANDSHEQEAQRVAQQAGGSSGHHAVQRETLPQVGPEGGDVDQQVAGQIQSGKQGGQLVPETVRRAVEEQTGADFSSVRVHTGSNAQQVNQTLGARAFTHGNHIFLGERQSPHDVQLMAHELTHTIQQGAVTQEGAQQQVARPGAVHAPATIQRTSDEMKEAKKKYKKSKKKVQNQQTKKTALKAGEMGASAINYVVSTPLTAIDQLTVPDLHMKDFYNYARTGKTLEERNDNTLDYQIKQLKRSTGRSGLSGYSKGLQSHEMMYNQENPNAFDRTFLDSYFNPLATASKAANAAKEAGGETDKELRNQKRLMLQAKRDMLLLKGREVMENDQIVSTLLEQKKQIDFILNTVMNREGVSRGELPDLKPVDQVISCYLSAQDRAKLKTVVERLARIKQAKETHRGTNMHWAQ